MPQTYNPVLLDSQDEIPNGPNSRFMRAVNCSLDIRKRVHTMMALEKKRYLGAIQTFEHHALLQQQRITRMEEKIRQRMRYNIASKQVYGSDDMHSHRNYHRALNEKITERARRYREGVNQALLEMDPSYQRQQKATQLLKQSKLDNISIIQRNLVELPVFKSPLGENEKTVECSADAITNESVSKTGEPVIAFSNKQTTVKTNQGIVTKLLVRKNTMYKTNSSAGE